MITENHFLIFHNKTELVHSRPFLFLIVAFTAYAFLKPNSYGQVLGASTEAPEVPPQMANVSQIKYESKFTQKETYETEELDFDIEYEDDAEIEYGEEEILEPGQTGVKKTVYISTYWGDELIDTKIDRVEIEEPRTQLTLRGTKVIWREYETEKGTIKYWRKLKVWATKYDGNCDGCRGLTYSGTRVVKGVCAVDPKVIPLGTNFWVDGYGMCRSEDIGGGVKGKWVDLGYEDVKKGGWRTGYTNVYLMTSSPDGKEYKTWL